MAAEGFVSALVAFSPGPREVLEWPVRVGEGSTLADAIAASPLRSLFPSLDVEALSLAVWGRKANGAQALRENDRIELLRPLKVDPKVARRERFRRQGARAAGLFARKP
jgi:uncharacterized protein